MDSSKSDNKILILILIFGLILFFLFSGNCPDVCKRMEVFTNSAPPYDNNKVYQLGDMVTKDGQTYKMIDGIGAAGYPPPRPTNWQPVGSSAPPPPMASMAPPPPPPMASMAPPAPPYDNNKVYKLGDMVTKDGQTYKMIDGIGAAGYPPPRPTNWREI